MTCRAAIFNQKENVNPDRFTSCRLVIVSIQASDSNKIIFFNVYHTSLLRMRYRTSLPRKTASV